MKTKTLFATTFATFITCAMSHADALTWSGPGGSTWDTGTTANWSGSAWAAGDDAIFGATGVGTVTIASGGVSANSLTFNTAGYTIAGGNLSLGGTITSNADATISSVIGGTAGLTTAGAGTLTLTSANTYTGATSVGAGRLAISGATAVSGFAGNTAVAAGATLEFNNDTDARILGYPMAITGAGTTVKSGAGKWYVGGGDGSVNFNLSAGGLLDIQNGTLQCDNGRSSFGANLGSIHVASGATLDFRGEDAQMDALTGAGAVTSTWGSGGHVTLGVSGGSGTFAGVISNGSSLPVNLIKNGAGIQTFAIRNEYSGSTTINAGRLVFESFNSSATYNIAGGAVLEFNYISGSDSPNHSLAWATFSGTGTLVKSGNDTLQWGYGTGTFNLAAGSLIDVQAGTLVGSNGGDENWTGNQASLNIASGAVFDTVEGNVRCDALTGAGTLQGAGFGSGSITIGVAGGSGAFAGVIQNRGGEAFPVTKVGAGTETLSGANTYSGSTTINGGRLVFQSYNSSGTYNIASGAALEFNAASGTLDQGSTTFSGTGTLVKSGAGNVQCGVGAATYALAAGSLIDVQAGTFIGSSNANENWTGNQSSLNIASGAVFDTVEGNVRCDALTGAGTLEGAGFGSGSIVIGVAGGSGTFAGVIRNRGGDPFPVTKEGAGTQVLTGANIYSGTTTINGGTLQIGNGTSGQDGSLVNTSIVNNASLVFNLAGSSSFSGAISGTGTTTVQAGTLSLTGTVAPTATLAIASGAVLHLPNRGATTVAALVINGSSQPNGSYGESNTGGAITGLGVIQVGPTGMTPEYIAWATSFSGFTDTYPTHDPDGDGMTNQQEFAFGLDPTSGASSNPIVAPLDKTTGKFSYTRLAPASSGLSYVIYTSPDLKIWTEDGGAVQHVTANDFDVETVEVTLSGLPLTAPKLFVRVAAQ
jgi:autotransporter-associated beta strand protein